jgi:hypothetical protein
MYTYTYIMQFIVNHEAKCDRRRVRVTVMVKVRMGEGGGGGGRGLC